MSRKWKYFHRSIFFRFKRKYFSLNALKMEILYKDSEYNKNLLKLSTLKTVVTSSLVIWTLKICINSESSVVSDSKRHSGHSLVASGSNILTLTSIL